MNYNAVISVEDVTDDSGVITEPVSLTEVKNYMRLDGFVDDGESTFDDDFDDSLLEIMIPAARQYFEESCGLSLIRKTFEAVLVNLCGRIEIPYGPIVSVTTLLDSEGVEITDYVTTGNMWKNLISPCYKDMTITYEAGYETIPPAMKLDLLRLIVYMYENRGEDSNIKEFSSQLTSKWSRKTVIF
jgi:hypothetical protein